MTLSIITATMKPELMEKSSATWLENAVTNPEFYVVSNAENNKGVLASMQQGYEQTKGDILCYLHDDVLLHEKGWDKRVLNEFRDPTVGVVGFGGALALGDAAIYKIPYALIQLARFDYFSNDENAEGHGKRFEGETDAATLDGFCLIVRRELLDKIGGWPVDRYPPHHNYDNYLCLQAHRQGYRVRLLGIKCHHLGGLTATSKEYNEWIATTKWKSDANVHEKGHRILYDEFRDVLPVRI